MQFNGVVAHHRNQTFISINVGHLPLFRINISGKVDITDLTWEQKERVLRFLFAKLNGAREKRGKTAPAHLSQSDSVVPSIHGKEAW